MIGRTQVHVLIGQHQGDPPGYLMSATSLLLSALGKVVLFIGLVALGYSLFMQWLMSVRIIAVTGFVALVAAAIVRSKELGHEFNKGFRMINLFHTERGRYPIVCGLIAIIISIVHVIKVASGDDESEIQSMLFGEVHKRCYQPGYLNPLKLIGAIHLHRDWMHYLGNVMGVTMLGYFLESIVPYRIIIIFIYVLNTVTFPLMYHLCNILGTSIFVYGLLGSVLCSCLLLRITRINDGVDLWALALISAYPAAQITADTFSEGNAPGHAYGYLVGLFSTLIFAPFYERDSKNRTTKRLLLALWIPLGLAGLGILGYFGLQRSAVYHPNLYISSEDIIVDA